MDDNGACLKYIKQIVIILKHIRVSFYDGVTFSNILVVNRIVVKRVIFKWFKLR